MDIHNGTWTKRYAEAKKIEQAIEKWIEACEIDDAFDITIDDRRCDAIKYVLEKVLQGIGPR